MTSWVVADSGVLLSSVLQETHSSKAETLLRSWLTQSIQLTAPSLIRYEFVAVVRKYVYRGVLTQDNAAKVRDLLLSKPIRLMLDDALVRRGYELATQFNRPTAYDRSISRWPNGSNVSFGRRTKSCSTPLNKTWAKWLGNFTG